MKNFRILFVLIAEAQCRFSTQILHLIEPDPPFVLKIYNCKEKQNIFYRRRPQAILVKEWPFNPPTHPPEFFNKKVSHFNVYQSIFKASFLLLKFYWNIFPHKSHYCLFIAFHQLQSELTKTLQNN